MIRVDLGGRDTSTHMTHAQCPMSQVPGSCPTSPARLGSRSWELSQNTHSIGLEVFALWCHTDNTDNTDTTNTADNTDTTNTADNTENTDRTENTDITDNCKNTDNADNTDKTNNTDNTSTTKYQVIGLPA